ncbi:MAG: AraC family ligand binding domain-containing protein [Eubacterium sp.]|nr:AraC family ligand binding domain-containing protein [Eubacterium sp.]
MENAFVLERAESRFKDLFVCFCGYAQCGPLHAFGPAVRPNYLLHYIIDGKGVYQTGEHKYFLGAGEGFLIEPDAPTYYQADQTEPWSYLWIGFSGSQAKEYLKDLGLNSSRLTFRCGQGKELKRLILKMLRCQDSSPASQYQLQSLLYAFFAVLARDAEGIEKELDSKENFYVERAIGYIRNYYSSQIRITDIANYLCVNRSYLYKLFQSSVQMSPQQFLTQFRISRAKELLSTTTLPVEHIASSCGYQNALVFSKAFKRSIGCTPTVYRTQHRNTIQENLQKNSGLLDELIQAPNHAHRNKMF